MQQPCLHHAYSMHRHVRTPEDVMQASDTQHVWRPLTDCAAAAESDRHLINQENALVLHLTGMCFVVCMQA